MTCRRTREEDVEVFREVRLRALQADPEAFGSTYEAALERSEESWREQIASCGSGGLRNTQLAFEGERCVGLAALYRKEGAAKGDLFQMWVEPECRGTEVATTLVRNLLEWAGESGMEQVGLGVAEANGRAIAFYEKLGFVATGERDFVDESRGIRGQQMLLRLG